MKYLILYAHPNPASFNHAILEQVKTDLAIKGHEIVVRDLYELNFNPILSAVDFAKFRQGENPTDIAEEQKYITSADRIIMIYPTWWASMPAIMKGYIDRVFAYGFSYQIEADGQLTPLLTDKSVLIFTTHGMPFERYEQAGMHDAFNQTVDHGIFNFVGIKILAHKYFGGVPTADDATRKAMLTEVTALINTHS